MIVMIAVLALTSPRAIFAEGHWASFDRGTRCEATTRADRIAAKDSIQAHLAILFGSGATGQLATRLSHTPQPGAIVTLTIDDQPFLLVSNNSFAWSRGPVQETAIIAAARRGRSMRVEARAANGGRFVDSYSLDGAPGALDAAAACAAQR